MPLDNRVGLHPGIGWNLPAAVRVQHALPVQIEFQPVIGALDHVVDAFSQAKRGEAMWATVTHRAQHAVVAACKQDIIV